MSPTLPASLRPAVAAPGVGPGPGVGPDGQHAFDELDDPLRDTTFVVLDLETTGGSPEKDTITEIGAVKVRGGEVLGEFATLIDPGRSIPPQIVYLTGITDRMVGDAPRLRQVLPGFLEFLRGSVLVAHNARFDIGFLKAACVELGLPWPGNTVLDTVQLARRVVSREESPSLRLGALAELFGASTVPNHRALADARATVDVLHALFERVGNLGVHSLSELRHLSTDVRPEQHRKRHLARGLPEAPGVYLFRGPSDEVLYVGTSRNLRRRVRSYFGSGQSRERIKEMVALATRVDHVVCAHALEAHVREQRLIAAHQPAYNRRSRRPGKVWWVVLTQEHFPRLSVVARPSTDAALGPFRQRADAVQAVEAIQEVTRIRRCSDKLSLRPRESACVLAELGRCGAPCTGQETVEQYRGHVGSVTDLVLGRSDALLRDTRRAVQEWSDAGRFDRAGTARDRLSVLADGVDRGQRLASFAAIEELVAARPDGAGGWEIAVIRHGRLAAAGTAVRGTNPMPVVELLQASAETVLPDRTPLPGASAEETTTVLRWVELPGTRLVATSRPWSMPIGAAGRWRSFVQAASLARSDLQRRPW